MATRAYTIFRPATPTQDLEIGSTEKDRRGRTWVVCRVETEKGSRILWKMMKSDFGFVLVDTEQIDEKRSQLIPTQTSESTMKDVAVTAGTGIKDVAVYLGPKVGAATVAAGSGIKDVAVYLGPKIGVAGTAIKDTSLSFGEMVWDKMTQTFIWWNTPTPKAVEEIEMTTDITHKNPLFELTDSTVERLN